METKQKNATCSICGKGYYMCQACKEQMNLQPWKIHTDTSEHFKIFQIIRGYSIGLYTKQEAKDKCNNVNLSDLKEFLPEIQSVIETILSDESVATIAEAKKEIKNKKQKHIENK